VHSIDLRLLTALDALLDTKSVTAAARRMALSPPAMSRTLARIRDAVGDPLLVRAGRRLEPTPRALALRSEVRAVVERAQAILRPGDGAPLEAVARTLTIRTSDAVVALAAAPLAARVRTRAPLLQLRFAPEGEEDVESLRLGLVELDIGNLALAGPELRIQKLCDERFVGLVRRGHPLSRGRVTPRRLAAHRHLSVSRRGRARGPLDEALARVGVEREVAAVVPTFGAALLAVATSDLVAVVPSRLARAAAPLGLSTLTLPVPTPSIAISQAWHPRFDADPAHRWLRACVLTELGDRARRPGPA
jgi:DNA-binding transcriptional LysR family regulator